MIINMTKKIYLNVDAIKNGSIPLSKIEGNDESTSNNHSFAFGRGLDTKNNNEFACGSYNISDKETTIFSIGIGSDNENRKNAFEIKGSNSNQQIYTFPMICIYEQEEQTEDDSFMGYIALKFERINVTAKFACYKIIYVDSRLNEYSVNDIVYAPVHSDNDLYEGARRLYRQYNEKNNIFSDPIYMDNGVEEQFLWLEEDYINSDNIVAFINNKKISTVDDLNTLYQQIELLQKRIAYLEDLINSPDIDESF